MGQVWTRDDWNQLIRDVNSVLQNPPASTSCSPIDPLDEVDEGHVWTKSDIREVQDKLKQTCADISFDDIPDKWLQSIIDDINTAKSSAWCGCNPTPPGQWPPDPPQPSVPSGTTSWVIAICDCSSGTIRVTDDNGDSIPTCQGCTGPCNTRLELVGSWPDVNTAYRLRHLHRWRACGREHLPTLLLASGEQWEAMFQAAGTNPQWVGTCLCDCIE